MVFKCRQPHRAFGAVVSFLFTLGNVSRLYDPSSAQLRIRISPADQDHAKAKPIMDYAGHCEEIWRSRLRNRSGLFQSGEKMQITLSSPFCRES
jgi:hypothetical protein